MKYRWQETSQIRDLIIKLEALRMSIDKTNRLPSVALSMRQKSLLKSAVYSARIEGLPDEESSPKKASQNLLRAYNHIYSIKKRKLSIVLIKNWHELILDKLSGDAGSFRSNPWAVFDQWGEVRYLAPMHFEVPKLMDDFVKDVNDLTDHPGIVAGLAQFVFEKIHPFADGNGRLGRLISAFVLESGGFGFRGLVPFEKYIESHRSEYYQTLESNIDATEFITFFLEALTNELDLVLNSFMGKEQENPESLLLPRRREMLAVISDHPYCSFDSIKRRFVSVNEKTLHNDLSQLIKKGFVSKIGSTRGALYMKAL